MLEEGKLSKGQPKSNEEVKVGETTRTSSGKHSSHKDKNILNNQLIMGVPNTTEEVEDETKKANEKFR